MTIKALLFDLGNVLVDIDWLRGGKKLADYMTSSTGKSYSIEDALGLIDPYKSNSVWDDFGHGKIDLDEFLAMMAEKTSIKDNPAIIKSALSEIFDPIEHRIALFNTLLAKEDLETVMVSDTNELHSLYIESYIPHIFTNLPSEKRFYSFRHGHMKKFGHEFYQQVLDTIGIEPKNALMIDDSIQNKNGADKIGMPFLHIQKDEDLVAGLASHRIFM